jgi:hypothetical protein
MRPDPRREAERLAALDAAGSGGEGSRRRSWLPLAVVDSLIPYVMQIGARCNGSTCLG